MANANTNTNIFGLKNLPKNAGVPTNVPQGNLLGLNLNRNLLTVLKPFDAGLFVDNDESKINEVALCGSKMSVRKVTETEKRPRGFLLTDPIYKAHLGKLSKTGTDAAAVIQQIILKASGGVALQQREYLDIPSGINEEDVQFIHQWVTDRRGQKLAVLFDYDRTLTVTEGGYFLGNGTSFQAMKGELETVHKVSSEGLTVEGFVEYYSGGYERLQMLQEMFDFLYTNNVTVYIVTNNGSCKKDGLFREIISVYTKGRPFVTVCGVDYGGNKKRAIESLDILKPICSAVGGRRRKTRRHTKKSKKTRRQTKKH
jgi:hypothetical protein